MREIKFRAWDKILKYMLLPDDGDNWISFDGQYFTTPDRTYDTPNTEIKKLTDVILMQYTGIKDKNGREVYEGDIVRITNRLNQIQMASLICKILFANGSFSAFWRKTEIWDGYNVSPSSVIHLVDNNVIEVIGNVYENPELVL